MGREGTREHTSSRAGGGTALLGPPVAGETRATLADAVAWVLPVPLAVLDREGCLVAVNDAWEHDARSGASGPFVVGSIGDSYLHLVPDGALDRDVQSVRAGIRALLERHIPSYAYEHVSSEHAQSHSSGASHRFLLHAARLPGGQGGAMLTQIDLGPARPRADEGDAVDGHHTLDTRDTAVARPEGDESAESAIAQLDRLRLIMDPSLSTMPVGHRVKAIVQRLKRAMRADNVTVLVRADDDDSLFVHTALGALAGTGVRVRLGRGIAGQIAASRKPLIVHDLSTREVVNPALKQTMVSLIGVPVKVVDRVVGVLHADSVRPRRFGRSDLEVMEVAAECIATTLELARLSHFSQVADARHDMAELRADQLDAVIETMTDGVVVTDRRRRVVRWNRAYHALMESLGAPGTDSTPLRQRLMPLNVRDRQGARLRASQYPVMRILRGEVLKDANALVLRIPLAEGGERAFILSGAPVRSPEGHITGAVAMLHDITEHQLVEQRTHQALRALLAMAQALTSPLTPSSRKTAPLEVLMSRLAELARQILDGDAVVLVATDAETGRLRALATAPSPQSSRHAVASVSATLTLHDVLAPEHMAALEDGRAIEDVTVVLEQQSSSIPDHWDVMAPLHVGARLIGVLGVTRSDGRRASSPAERALAVATARVAALVLDHERLLLEREEGRARELALEEVTQRMDDFLAIASHDLRSPLTTVVGGIQLAALKYGQLAAKINSDAHRAAELAEAEEGVRRCLLDADQSAERLSRMVALLFDTSRAQSGSLDLHLAPCDLAALTREHVARATASHPGRTIRAVKGIRGHTMVQADADRIEEVLANFLSNAIKYSPSDRPIDVSLRIVGTQARVSVKDQGPGLPADEQTHVWERFYRAKGVRAQDGAASGLGLGLHICKMIVTAHGGNVGVTSRESNGSMFWFELPLASAHA